MLREVTPAGTSLLRPPVKMVPSSHAHELCYSRLLGAPPLAGGMTDQYYDARINKIHSGWWQRSTGWRQPWEKLLDYNARYLEASLTYLNPRDWLGIEMGRIREALNNDRDKLTIVYTGHRQRHGEQVRTPRAIGANAGRGPSSSACGFA
jgi:hypothetical protein